MSLSRVPFESPPGNRGCPPVVPRSHASRSPLVQASLCTTIANFGFNFGCRPDAYLADTFCESLRLVLHCGAVPVQLLSPINGPASPVAAAPLEVDSRGTFEALALLEHYPALCARSDSVYGRSAWQLSARHFQTRLLLPTLTLRRSPPPPPPTC